MALADHAPEANPTGHPCSIGTLLATLDEGDAAELQAWLDAGYSATAIWNSLKAAGHSVSLQQINRHRNSQNCRCWR